MKQVLRVVLPGLWLLLLCVCPAVGVPLEQVEPGWNPAQEGVMPPANENNRLITVSGKNLSDLEYHGKQPDVRDAGISHDFELKLVFPIRGGKVYGTYIHDQQHSTDPRVTMNNRHRQYNMRVTYSGPPDYTLSGMAVQNKLGGGYVPFSGVLKPDGKGYIIRGGKYRMDVTYAPFGKSPENPSASGGVSQKTNPDPTGSTTSLASLALLAGAGGYLLLHLLGLLGTKTAVGTTASTTGGMVAATSETMESVPVSASGSAEAEGMTREPSVGDTRTYLDEQGTRWVEVFNGQNWVDSATNAAQQQQVTENQSWQKEQAQRQEHHDTAFDREQQARPEESRQQLAEKQAVARQDYKQSLREMQELHENDQTRAADGLARAEAKTRVMEWAKETVDFTVQAVSSFTGPAGWVVGNAYTLASDVAEGVSQGVGDADTLSEGVVEAVKGTFNGLATGLCKVAVGETMSAAGAGLSYGLRTVQHRLVHFNPGKAQLTPLFHSSLPATELVQMAKNLSSGKSLMTGVNKGLAEVGVQSFRKAVSGESFSVAKARYELRPSSLTKLHADKVLEFGNKARHADFWGTLQGLRGIAIDDPIGQTLAENMFHIP